METASGPPEKFGAFARRRFLLTTFAKDDYLVQGLAAGARGYLLKDIPVAEVGQAIEEVVRGHTWIIPTMQGRLGEILSLESITPRERQLLALAETGATNRQIAETLHLAEGSVKNVRTEIFRKLSVHNRVEAVACARDKGLI